MVKQCFGRRICPISSSAPRPLGAAYVPILLSEVEQEQRLSGNGDREAIVVGAGLCDGNKTFRQKKFEMFRQIFQAETSRTILVLFLVFYKLDLTSL